jgi:hypothetical protein
MKYSRIDSVITAFIVDNSNLNELKCNEIREVRTLTNCNTELPCRFSISMMIGFFTGFIMVVIGL